LNFADLHDCNEPARRLVVRHRWLPLVATFVVTFGGITLAEAQEAQRAVKPAPTADATRGIARLQWLAGCWASERGEPGSGEQWTAPAGGTMLGTSRMIKAGRTVEYEFVVIRQDDGEGLAYVAHPSGQALAAFQLARIAEREVLFENPTHDYPQRVGYRLDASGKHLLAWIEGTREGRARRVEFPMLRTPCDPAPSTVASVAMVQLVAASGDPA
jgi:hypothetical protein